MIDLGQYADYIVWGYAGVALAIVALVAWVVTDSRRVAAKLKTLEEQGVRRRSAGTNA